LAKTTKREKINQMAKRIYHLFDKILVNIPTFNHSMIFGMKCIQIFEGLVMGDVGIGVLEPFGQFYGHMV
jgi:hypothetical protein